MVNYWKFPPEYGKEIQMIDTMIYINIFLEVQASIIKGESFRD